MRLMATIYKKRGTWYIDYVLHGKKITRNTKLKSTESNKSNAEKLKKDIEELITDDSGISNEKDTFLVGEISLNKAIELYSKIFIEGKSGSHKENFDYVMKRFKTIVSGTINIKQIKIEHFSKFVTSMKPNLSQATMVTYFQYLSSMFNFLKESGYIDQIPIAKGVRPKKAVKNIINFDPVDLENILNLSKEKDLKYYLSLKLFLLTGQRPGDVLRLKVRDFDFHRQIINFNVSKTASEFKLPIYAKLEKFLVNEMKIKNITDKEMLLFPDLTVNAIGKAFRKIKKELGINKYHYYTLKTFRKNFATDMSKMGLTIQEVQALLDHKSPSTTLRYYANVKADELKVKIDRLQSNR